MLISALGLPALAQSTAFTYQGRLNDNSTPANGSYDLQFALFDAPAAGNPIGSTLTTNAVAVSNGLFTVPLDFGNQFPGADRWLEIGVRTNGGDVFTTLIPRNAITPSPYAIYSGNAGTAVSAITAGSANSVSATNVFGTLTNNTTGNAAGATNGPDGGLLAQGRPFTVNQTFDTVEAIRAQSPFTAGNGTYYRYGTHTFSNSWYGADPQPYAYTNAAGWWWVCPTGSGANYVSNNANALIWAGTMGSCLGGYNGSFIPWNIQFGLYFAFGRGTTNTDTAPDIWPRRWQYDAASTYKRIFVFEGDSRMAGWNNPAAGYQGNLALFCAGHPFFQNAYLTNFAKSGDTTSMVSNRYASHVYPLRPTAGQKGYYVVLAGANGDGAAQITSTMQPLFKQAKKDGWTVVTFTQPPSWYYGNPDLGLALFDENNAIRNMFSSVGNNGCWDILVDFGNLVSSMHDQSISTDGLHLNIYGAAKLGEYLALRMEQGTATDSLGIQGASPFHLGTYALYGKTNVVFRIPTNYTAMFKGGPLIVGEGLAGATNAASNWPTVPSSPGAYAIVNSNGTVYMLTSLPDTQTWNATNKLAP